MLLESKMKKWHVLDTVTRPDGYGGFDEVSAPGAPFDAACTLKSNTEAQIAYANGVKKLYAVVTRQTVRLKRGMKIQRDEDGLVLKVTSDAADMQTPAESGLKLYQVTAEVVEV